LRSCDAGSLNAFWLLAIRFRASFCPTLVKWVIAIGYLRPVILLAGLTALFMGVGYLLGGWGGAFIAFFIAAAMNFVTYWNADRLVLSMHGAQEVDERMAPEFVRIVAELANRAGLPVPRVYLMDNPQNSIFANGCPSLSGQQSAKRRSFSDSPSP
jgi:Zn-dependent protease with chaperone function